MAAIPWGRSVDIQTFYEQWHKDDPTKTLSDMMVYMTRLREEDEEQANRDAQEEMAEWAAAEAEAGYESWLPVEIEGDPARATVVNRILALEDARTEKRRVLISNGVVVPVVSAGVPTGVKTYTGDELDFSEWDMERFFVLHQINESIGVPRKDARDLEDYQELLLAAVHAEENEAMWAAEAADRVLL